MIFIIKSTATDCTCTDNTHKKLRKGEGVNKNNSLEVIEDCTTYIKNHLQDTLTAEALASRYGYSLYHFCHIFKICCDMSPGKYIRLLRLEKAKKDILSGMSITQTGFDNGFETSSGFSKAFRKEYGISAREYLKQNKESEVFIMLHFEIKTLQSQTALGYEIPGEYDSDYSKSGAYWNHINFKEYPAYQKESMIMAKLDYGPIPTISAVNYTISLAF